MAKASWAASFFLEKIFANQNLHQLVPVDLADHGTGIVVVGDVGGVLGQKVTYDLVDGVIAFLSQSFIHTPEGLAHISVISGYNKL